MARAPGLVNQLPLPYGAFRRFLDDPLTFQLRARGRFGDVFRFRVGPLLIHFLYHPDHVRRVLYDQQKNYLRGWQYNLLRRLMGENIVVSEGDYWLRQRRLAQPAFHRQRLAGYAGIMVDATTRMLDRWRLGMKDSGPTIAIAPEMSRVAMAIAGLTMFGRDVSHEADVVGREFPVIGAYLERRFNHPFTTPPAWVPTPMNLRYKRAFRTLNEIVLGLVRDRRLEGRDHGDLLSMLMAARDAETGEAMTDSQLRSESLAFLMAGQETTATALTWTWYFLASDRAMQSRVREEVATVLGDGPPTIENVTRLTFTRAVVEEAMRLYPPVWAVARQPVRDDEVGGYRVPARSNVVLCPYVTHRHPEFWERPDRFDPERFTPENAAGRPKGAYFPFLGGPHQCIGHEFAMLEMRIVVAMIAREFDLELIPGQDIRPMATIAIRPSGPVRVNLRAVAS